MERKDLDKVNYFRKRKCYCVMSKLSEPPLLDLEVKNVMLFMF